MSEANKSAVPAFYAMTLRELAAWVTTNNAGLFDSGEFPTVDDLTDDEADAAREEYEAMADEILAATGSAK
jgi:hypothetical protein